MVFYYLWYSVIANLKYFAIAVVIFIILLMRGAKLSFSELYNSSIEKVIYKIEKLKKNGFNTNMTYLYYTSNNNEKRNNIIQKNILEFINIANCLMIENDNYCSSNKISLKLNQLGESYEESFKNLKTILDEAEKNNIFVWIASHRRENMEDELKTYFDCIESGYENVGITLACYHESVGDSVDKILRQGGNIRLVKGYYKDGEIKDDSIITKNYYENAIKLIEDKQFHQLAGHDFKNIIFPLYLKYKNTEYDFETNDKLEFGFFYNALKHVKYNLKSYNIVLKNKCCLVTYGNKVKYFKSNIGDISIWKMLKVKAII